MSANKRLYHHKTDGGAEYLCLHPIPGTDEGDLYTTVVRLDGEPELFTSNIMELDTMNALLKFVDDIERYVKAGGIATREDRNFVLTRCKEAREGIAQ